MSGREARQIPVSMYNYRFIKGKQGLHDKWEKCFTDTVNRRFQRESKRFWKGLCPPSSSQAVPLGRTCGSTLPAPGMCYLGTAEPPATPTAFPPLQLRLINNVFMKGISPALRNKCSHTACISTRIQVTWGIKQRCN